MSDDKGKRPDPRDQVYYDGLVSFLRELGLGFSVDEFGDVLIDYPGEFASVRERFDLALRNSHNQLRDDLQAEANRQTWIFHGGPFNGEPQRSLVEHGARLVRLISPGNWAVYECREKNTLRVFFCGYATSRAEGMAGKLNPRRSKRAQ